MAQEADLQGEALSGMYPEEIREQFTAAGWEPFRAQQVSGWISKGVLNAADMRNLPQNIREALAAKKPRPVCTSSVGKILRDPDGTVKLQIRLDDASAVETVLLSDAAGRKTACVSSQAGCPLACRFCKTGTLGFRRNLRAGEITEQFLFLEKEAGKLDNIVFMGMGEPLLNLHAVRKAVAILTAKSGRALSRRRITISTAGICSGIYDLADNGPDVRLAVSLTTADPGLRRELMPVEKNNPLPELKKALRRFCEKTGRRITLEAAMLRNVNMSRNHARQLAEFCAGLHANVNLIPWNPVEGLPFSRPSPAETKAFSAELESLGVNVVVRYPRGRSVAGACGQLGETGISVPQETPEKTQGEIPS